MIGVRLNFKTYIEHADRVNTALSRIMTNIGGSNQTRRLLLAKVTQFIMRYAAPVWGPESGIRTYAGAARSLFRLSEIGLLKAFAQFHMGLLVSHCSPYYLLPLLQYCELQRIKEKRFFSDQTLCT